MFLVPSFNGAFYSVATITPGISPAVPNLQPHFSYQGPLPIAATPILDEDGVPDDGDDPAVELSNDFHGQENLPASAPLAPASGWLDNWSPQTSADLAWARVEEADITRGRDAAVVALAMVFAGPLGIIPKKGEETRSRPAAKMQKKGP